MGRKSLIQRNPVTRAHRRLGRDIRDARRRRRIPLAIFAGKTPVHRMTLLSKGTQELPLALMRPFSSSPGPPEIRALTVMSRAAADDDPLVAISLEKVEALAPDQASLAAARSLLKPALWPTLAEAEGLCWGECQGSGATPYRVVVNEADHGYKCTCPSRKFPCKHSLALMWIRAEAKLTFASSPVPEWVKDWLSRRRPDNKPDKKLGNPEASQEAENESGIRPSVRIALQAETVKKADPQADARSAAARERNRAGREEAILEGLSHLETWLSDQIDRGMVNFVATCNQTCRAIAQRLVDTKAPGLASRIDALPTRLFTIAETARPYAAIRELGQIHLISAAYRRTSELDEGVAADARQAVGWAVTREALLADPAAVRLRSRWTVFAVVTEAQPDRLRRIETWLCREQPAGDDAPQYAVLIDFVPLSGSASSGYVLGDRLEAELVYYRSSLPLRAVIANVKQGAQPSSSPVPAAAGSLADAYSSYERALQTLPWLGSFPLSFREATVRRRGDELYLCDKQLALPVHSTQRTQALPLTGAGPLEGIGLWNGYELTLACAETPLGRWVRR